MSEQRMRLWTVKTCRPFHARPVENTVDPGYPDVEMVGATIECKAINAYPVRDTTCLLIHHYTQHQRLWAKRRTRAGGNHSLLLRVDREWLLFKGEPVWKRVGLNATKAELRELAVARWNGTPDEEEFRAAVMQ